MIPPLLPMLRATLKNCESGWGHLNSIGKEGKRLFFQNIMLVLFIMSLIVDPSWSFN